jgi:hypothetical protein
VSVTKTHRFFIGTFQADTPFDADFFNISRHIGHSGNLRPERARSRRNGIGGGILKGVIHDYL